MAAVSSNVAVPVVIVTVLLVVAIAGVGVFLFVKHRRRLAIETARPFTDFAQPDADVRAEESRSSRPSFINIMPVVTVLTAPVSPSVASSFQTREPAPEVLHRRASLYVPSPRASSIRSNPFSDGHRPRSAGTASVLDLSGTANTARNSAMSRAPSVSTVRTATSRRESAPAPHSPARPVQALSSIEHPFSPDFRPAHSNPVALRVRTSVLPTLFSPTTSVLSAQSASSRLELQSKTKPLPKTPPEDRDTNDPPPSYTPRSGVSAFAVPRSSVQGHARSPSAGTWDSADEL